MRTVPNKFAEGWRVIEPDARLYARVAYIKVTEWSLTTSGPTGRAVWIGYQLGWLAAQQIGGVNLNVLKIF